MPAQSPSPFRGEVAKLGEGCLARSHIGPATEESPSFRLLSLHNNTIAALRFGGNGYACSRGRESRRRIEGLMNGIILRWGVPALVTVVGGTSLAVSATSSTIRDDLTARATQTLTTEERNWATVSFDGRDAVTSGTAMDQGMIDNAVTRIAAVHGVRSVNSKAVVAERVSPFPFTATVSDGAVSLTGGVPDESAHARIALAAAPTDDSLRILAGAPPRDRWEAAVTYGLQYLAQFDEGTVSLSDLALTVSGRAKSAEAYDALALLVEAPLPEGIELVGSTIEPAIAVPFEWRAEFDGTRLRVSGFVSRAAFADELRASGIGGRPVSTSLTLASGAPEGFEERARLLLENLVQLEHGSADISDSTATLTGAPADGVVAESIRMAMTPVGVALDLDPPRVEGYEFTATRSGGAIVLDGFVPDAPTRDRLEAITGIDASGLDLARGAPERFDSAVDFGLDLLEHLSEGRFSLRDTTLSIEGRAATLPILPPSNRACSGAAGPAARPPRSRRWFHLHLRRRKSADGRGMSGYAEQRTRAARYAAGPGRHTTLADATRPISSNRPSPRWARRCCRPAPLLTAPAAADRHGRNRGAGAPPKRLRATGLGDTGWSPSTPSRLPPSRRPSYLWHAFKTADGRSPRRLRGSEDNASSWAGRQGGPTIPCSAPASRRAIPGALAGMDALCPR